ncbi:hypothetical protein ACOI1C_11050 [Bacillus sp. DJP31]|uniref:hypothetical protein n=1 Tax=Bacillus sp. DJP31 TaxID=3409789 RepID=UPI003BB5E954
MREQEKKITHELNQYKQAQRTNVDENTYISENIRTLWEHADDIERKQIMTTIFNQLVIDTEDD